MSAAPPTVELSRGDSRLLADLRSLERLVGSRRRDGERLERALGPELAGMLLFALAPSRAGEAAA